MGCPTGDADHDPMEAAHELRTSQSKHRRSRGPGPGCAVQCARRRGGRQISGAAGHPDRALPGRRRGRCGRPHRGRQARDRAWPAVHHRQSRRRGRRHRHAHGGARRPDGYTLVLAHTGSTSINPSLYANPGYDPRVDFAPIGLISSTPVVLMAHPSFAAQSIAELIAMAKKEPGKLNFGTPPPGTGGYLAAELFKSMSGADMTIIPYKGTAALTTDLLGGHVPVGFNVIAPAMGSLRGEACARSRWRAPPARACSRKCRRWMNPACPASRRCCTTACWRRPARPRRSSRGSTRSCARWSRRRTCASASRPTAAIRCHRARSNMPPTSTARRRSGRP